MPTVDVCAGFGQVTPKNGDQATWRSHRAGGIEVRAQDGIDDGQSRFLPELGTRSTVREELDVHVHIEIFRVTDQGVDQLVQWTIHKALGADSVAAAETCGVERSGVWSVRLECKDDRPSRTGAPLMNVDAEKLEGLRAAHVHSVLPDGGGNGAIFIAHGVDGFRPDCAILPVSWPRHDRAGIHLQGQLHSVGLAEGTPQRCLPGPAGFQYNPEALWTLQ